MAVGFNGGAKAPSAPKVKVVKKKAPAKPKIRFATPVGIGAALQGNRPRSFNGGAQPFVPPTTYRPPPAAPAAPPAPTARPAGGGTPGLPFAADIQRENDDLRARTDHRILVEAPEQKKRLNLDYYGSADVSDEMIRSGGFDPTNPFSRAALLNRSYRDKARGTNTSMAAAGQIYSGAARQQEQLDTDWYGQGINTLTQQYQGESEGIERATQAANDADQDRTEENIWRLTQNAGADIEGTTVDPASGSGGGSPSASAGASRSRAHSGVTRNGVDIGVLDAAMGFSRGVGRSAMADRMRANPNWGPQTLANNGPIRGHSVAF